MNTCWLIPRNVSVISATFRGKHHAKCVLDNHFRGPIIPIESMIECRQIPAKDIARLHQFGKKVLPSIFVGSAL